VDAEEKGVRVLCVYIIFIGEANRLMNFYFQGMVIKIWGGGGCPKIRRG
jgi:hypothetical protein